MQKKRATRGFNASALQIVRAYKKFFGVKPADSASYEEMGKRLVEEMGWYEAERFVLSQSNDPELQD